MAEVLQTLSRTAPTPTGLADTLHDMAQRAVSDFTASREREGGRRLSCRCSPAPPNCANLPHRPNPWCLNWLNCNANAFSTAGNEALGLAEGQVPEASAAQERALSEATAFAIRIDVAEELTRLMPTWMKSNV